MPAPANLVHQSSSTTGTGNFTLAAVNGKQSFDTAFGHGVTTNVFDYFISNRGAAEWERGTGHMSDSTTLVRDTVIESTNSNAAVSFSAGTKDVTCGAVAQNAMRNEGSASVSGALLTAADTTGRKVSTTTFTVDDLMTTVSLLALQVADNSNVALFLGDKENRVFDSFDTLTYVNTGGATNLDSSSAGVLKPTISYTDNGAISQATGTAIGDMTAGGNLAAAFDGTTSQANSACASKATATSGYVGKDYSAAPKRIYSAVVYGSNDQGFLASANISMTLSLYGKQTVPTGPTDAGMTLLASTTFTDTSDESAGRTLTSSDKATQWAYPVVVESVGSSQTLRMAELVFHEAVAGSANNMTVTSTAFTAASAPSTMRGIIRVKEVDAATAGTDYTFEVSRDGGTTWTTATLSELFTSPSPDASIVVCRTTDTDVSGQPSGTSPMWRFKTLNNKNVQLYDAALYWN